MPRARKASQKEIPPGQPYGDRQRLEQAMAEAPPAGVPVPQAPPAPDPRQALLAKAAMGPSPLGSGIAGPSQRPGEPITAGIPRGLGPGPEVLQLQSRSFASEGLRKIAMATGDDDIMRLADLARMRGA